MASQSAINRSWFVLLIKAGITSPPSFHRTTANLRAIAGLFAIPRALGRL
jgi:hypothetical protein